MQVKNLHVYRSFSWGGTEIIVWTGLVEDLTVYFLEPQNGYASADLQHQLCKKITPLDKIIELEFYTGLMCIVAIISD